MASAQIPRFAVSDTSTFVFVVVCVSKRRCEHAHVRFVTRTRQQVPLRTRPRAFRHAGASAGAVANTPTGVSSRGRVSNRGSRCARGRFVTRSRQQLRFQMRPRAFCHGFGRVGASGTRRTKSRRIHLVHINATVRRGRQKHRSISAWFENTRRFAEPNENIV